MAEIENTGNPDNLKDLFEMVKSTGAFKDESEFRTFVSDKNNLNDVYEMVKPIGAFKDKLEFDDFTNSLKKKEPTTPQGQGILKSGFGEYVSDGTKADFGSTTIIKEQADKAQKELKTVPPTPENPIGVHPDNLKSKTTAGQPILDLSVGEKLKKEQEDNITSQDALNLHNTQLKDVLEHDENYFKNKNYKTDLSNNISEIISSDKNKGVYFDKKGAAIIDNVSKLVDGIAERAKKEQGVEISPLDKQKIILDAVASAKSKDVQLQAHLYADLETKQKYGVSISDFTDLTEKVADPTSKTGYKTVVVKEGIFSKMNKDYTNFSVQKNKELKTLYKKNNTDVNAEIQPEIQQYKGEIEQQSNLLNNRIKEEFDAQVSQIGTEIQGKYQQLVSSGQIDAQTANAQSQAEYQKAQEDLQVGLQSKYKGDFDKLTSDVENKNKQFQLKYNKLYNQKTKSATEGANRELDLKLNELKSQYKVPDNILETYKKEYSVAYNKFTIDKNAKELANFRNLPTESKLAISFASGIGNLLSSTGGAMGWMGFENASLTLNKLAQQNAENAGVPAIQYNDLTFLSDPDWWIVNTVQSMPLMLATMPLSFGIGAAGGWMAKLAQAGTIDGEIAAALGEQTLTQEVASVAAGGFAGWASETMLEAGDSFSSAINEGKTKEEAAQIASATFKRDLATLPLSIAQMLPIFGKGFKFLETAGVETASNYLEEIAQGWAQTKSKAEQEGVDVSFGDYFFSSEAQQAGAAGAICGNLYTLAAFKKTDNKEKQLNSILNSITVGGANQARTQLEILKNNSVITNEEFVKANRLVGYTLKAIDKVSNININDDTKVALIGKFAEIEKFKELTTDNPQDLASQAAKEIIAEKEKEIKSILKGETPIYLVHPKGYEVPMVVTKDVALEIAKSNNASDFRIMVYNDDTTQTQLDKINEKNAIQKSSTGEILQRQPQGAGSKGSESTGVESGIEGEEVALKSKTEKVEPITPKEGDIVELQPRVKGGMKPQAVFKDGKWQAKVGKETSEIGKAAQEEAQAAFESSIKTTLEPKNEVNGGENHQPYAGKSVIVKGAPKGHHLNIGLFEGDTDRLMTHNEVLAMLPEDVKVVSYKEVQGTEPTLSIETSRKLTDDEVTKLLSETKQLAISQLSEGVGVLHKNGSPESEAWGEFNPEFFVTQEGKSLLEHAKSKTPEIIPEEVHTPIVSRLSKMGFAIKSLAGDSWHSAVELAKKGGAKFMSFGGYEKTGFEETKEYKDLVKSGHIVENFNILGIKGRPVYITSPDNMMVGDIHFGDTHIIKGEGGVHFVSKTGHVWAFKKGANTMVKFINEEIKKNGSANIVLTKGGLGKTLNTHVGAIGAMHVLENLMNNGYISLSIFKNALTAVGKKYDIKLSTKDDIKSIQESIKNGFYEREDSTFENRGTFISDFVKEITTGIRRDKKTDIEAIKKALNTDRTLGKGVTLNKDNVIDAIGGLFSDEITLDAPIGYAYAVIQVSSEVKSVNIDKTEGGHDAYPEHVVTVDGSRPKLLILDKPQYIGDIANDKNNNVVVNKKDVRGNVKYPHQQLGSNNTGFTEGVMKTDFNNKKQEGGKDLIELGGKRKQMTEDDKGNYLFFHYSKTKFNKLNPNKVGTHLATGRDERTATPVSSLYTRPDVGEANVPNDFGYVVRVPKDKVYDFNSDPLNLKKEAESRFKKENPNRAFDANNQLAEVAKLAAEKGFQVTVADWNIKGTKTLIAKTSESLPLENYNNIKLGTMNQVEFAKGMEDIKANAKRRDIKYNDVSVKYMTDANGNIFGFVKDGEITLNGDKKTANTPIHEAGHIWIGKVKENNPELYKAGMNKVDGSKYLEDVKNEKLYQDEADKLPEDMQEDYFREEALAKAIGDNGEKFATDAKKSDFKTWVLSMWKAVAKEFGLHNMSPEEVSKLTLDEFSKKAAADILGGKGENAPENLKKLAEDNNLPSFRNVVNLVNKYVREVKLEEGKTITDTEVKQALKNKEEGVTREGWVSKTKESGRTVSYKENKIPVSSTYNEIVNENKHYYETLNIKENSNKAIEYLEEFGTDAKGLKDAYDDLMAAFAINPFTNPINGVAAEILSDKLYAQAVAENIIGNIDGYNEYVKLSNNLREASFKAATVAGQYTSALAILCRASNPEAFLMFVNGQINEIINNKNNVNKIKKIKTKTEEISDRINQAKKESINEIVNSKSIPSKSGISTSISKIRERGLKRQQESLVKLSKIGHLGSNGLSNESIEAVGDLILSQIELGIYNIANIAQKIIVLTNGKVKAEHIKEVLTKYKTNYEGEDVYLKDAIEKISEAEKLAKKKALLEKGEIEKFSEKRVSEDVRKIKTLNDLLKANLEAGSTIEAMASEMVETFSMSQKEADIIANKYYNGYKKLLEEKIDKILKKELGIKTIAYFEKLENSTETKSYEKTFGGKIVNQILAGGLDSQMLSQAFSLKYGLPILTPAISDHIKLLASRAKAATTPTSLLFANKNLLSYIHSIVPSDFMSVLNSAYYISMLSGVSTAVVNTVGNLHELINLRTENAIVSIIEASKGEKDNLVSGKNSINKIQYIIKNFQEAMISALDIMQHGGGESKYFNISQKDLKQTDAEELKLKRGWVKDLTFKNLLSTLGKTWYTVPVVVVRNLDALDIAFGKLNYNIIAVRETRKELAKTGLKGKELEAATFQKVYGTKEIIQKAIEDAIVEANNIGANQSERKKLVKRIAYDLIQKSLSEKVQNIANETSREYTFKGKSRGFTGALAKKIPQTAIITPFVQTVMKVVESGMNYIPVYGGMRYAGLSITDIARNASESVDTWYTSKGIERTKREGDFRNRQLAQVVLSHTLLLTLYALSKIKWHDDDKNEDVPFVDISGGYLGVPMTKRAEAEKVMPQYMIRIGNFTVNYTLNPALAMVCLPLSIEMDRRRAHQDERTVTGDVLSYAGALPIFLLEQTPLQSVNDFAKSLRNIADKTSGLDNYEELGKLLEKAVLSVPSTLAEPNLYKQSENFYNPTKYNANTVEEVAWKCFNMEKIGGLDYKYDHWGRKVELYPNETKFPIHFWLQQAGDDVVDNWALKNNLTLPILNPKTLVLDMATMSSSTKKSFDEKQKNLAEYYDIIESENQNYKKENQIDVSVFTPNFKVLTYKEWHDMDKSTRFSVYNIIKDNFTKIQESHPSFITKPFSEMNKIEAQIIVDNLFKVEKINYIKEKFPIK